MSASTRRILKDVADAMLLKDCGIHVCQREDDILHVDALIEGPRDTPYEGGYFQFDIKFPADYPFTSPRVILKTTGGNTVRFNPNFYACGKVCLSILGTWAGPSWAASLTLRTVLLSIQSLMCEFPLRNEPGFECENGIAALERYNDIIRHETLRVALLGTLKECMNGISCVPEDLQVHISQGAANKLCYFDRVCSERQGLDGKVMEDFFGEKRGTFQFGALLAAFRQLLGTQIPTPSISSGLSCQKETCTSEDSENMIAAGETCSGEMSSPAAPTLGTEICLDENDKVCQLASHAPVRGEGDVAGDDIPDELKCGVCFDIIATAAVLGCGHVFCFLCAHQWLERKSMCPSCREHCDLDSLRRIFTLDTIAEREARARHTHAEGLGEAEALQQWCLRRDEGVKLANGKRLEKTKSTHGRVAGCDYGYDGEFYEDEYGSEDEDDGFDFGYPAGPPGGYGSIGTGGGTHSGTPSSDYGPQAYFLHRGGPGTTLGGVSSGECGELNTPSAADLKAARLKRFALKPSEADVVDSTPLISAQSIQDLVAMGFAQCDVERCLRASSGDREVATEYLISGIPSCSIAANTEALSCSSQQPTQMLPSRQEAPRSARPASTSSSAPLTPEEVRDREIARAKDNMRCEMLERKRLRLEIARDKEERKKCGGKLPATHEPLFSKSALDIVETYSRVAPLSGGKSIVCVPQDPYEKMTSAIERIADRSVNSSTATVKTALSVMMKILQNIDESPEEEKYRSINTTGRVYKEKLCPVVGIKALLHALGFISECTGNVSRLYLPAVDITLIKDARSRLFIFQDSLP